MSAAPIPVTGATRLVGVIGDPIGHVRTPTVLNALLMKRGIDAIVVPLHVGRNQLAGAMGALRSIVNLAGLLVTIPHKKAIVEYCDDVSDAVRIASAANIVRRDASGRLYGAITDGVGFVASLRARGVDVTGQRVYLAGAGGAASAIAAALVVEGVELLTIANRTIETANVLAARLRSMESRSEVRVGGGLSGHALVINATSLGLQPQDAPPFDVAALDGDVLVADIVMGETNLIQKAAKLGLRTHLGAAMLEHQLATFIEILNLAPRPAAGT